jgi:RNA polymerase sigma-70 factor (ECF subfamily)
VELALLVVLETLSPLERAVFVLREAFGLPFADIATAIGRAEPAVRQLARRARDHIEERKPRFDVDRGERRRITERFIGACVGGDLDGLLSMLSDDVTLVGDGGGKAKAPLRVLEGAETVARFLTVIATEAGTRRFMASIGRQETAALGVEVTEVNGGPAVVITAEGVPVTVMSLVVTDGLITTVYLIANPEKMSHLDGTSPGAGPAAPDGP